MTRMREIGVLLSHAAVTTTAALPDVDLGKYYVSPGSRELMATLVAVPTGADTDEKSDVKLQESATTVDSDFTDITGATFTQISQEDSTPAIQQIFFTMGAGKRYVRPHHTGAGTTIAFTLSVSIFAVKRSA